MSLFMAGVHRAVHNNSQHLEAFSKQLKKKQFTQLDESYMHWSMSDMQHLF